MKSGRDAEYFGKGKRKEGGRLRERFMEVL